MSCDDRVGVVARDAADDKHQPFIIIIIMRHGHVTDALPLSS